MLEKGSGIPTNCPIVVPADMRTNTKIAKAR
jgi:hypothetical protein